ncbi:hypothetical protein MFLAVUS_009322 [Mucor flavus]|uniref:Uncharacterized protein n=1 Tax=Mucor flavus TaxID=439312 RepID=A0ABP9Z9N1_9FUNG
MVEVIYDQEEWAANSEDTIKETASNNHNGQFRYGLGDKLNSNSNLRVLDGRREVIINQRKRADGHLFCSEVTWPKVQKRDDKDFNGQQDVNKVHDQRRRYSISSFTGLCSESSRPMQLIPFGCNLPAYQRDRQCRSGQVVKDQETNIRECNTKIVLSTDTRKMGYSEDRHFPFKM